MEETETLLSETLQVLDKCGLTPKDVLWVGDYENYCDWDNFALKANFEYDSGFGLQEINPYIVIAGKDWWLERHEYDGSERWEYKKLPEKPSGNDVNKIIITTPDWKRFGSGRYWKDK